LLQGADASVFVAVRRGLDPDDRPRLLARDDLDRELDRRSVRGLGHLERPADDLARRAARGADGDGPLLRRGGPGPARPAPGEGGGDRAGWPRHERLSFAAGSATRGCERKNSQISRVASGSGHARPMSTFGAYCGPPGHVWPPPSIVSSSTSVPA